MDFPTPTEKNISKTQQKEFETRWKETTSEMKDYFLQAIDLMGAEIVKMHPDRAASYFEIKVEGKTFFLAMNAILKTKSLYRIAQDERIKTIFRAVEDIKIAFEGCDIICFGDIRSLLSCYNNLRCKEDPDVNRMIFSITCQLLKKGGFDIVES
jgi:hypothetical protein